MGDTEGWTQAVGTASSHFERIYRQLKGAYYDDIGEKDKVIKHLESKLKEKDDRIKQLKLEMSDASSKHQDRLDELNEVHKNLVKSETEAKHWREKSEAPCEKCAGLREQLQLLQGLLTKDNKRSSLRARLHEDSEDLSQPEVRRSPRKHKKRSSALVDKSSGPSQNVDNRSLSSSAKRDSQTSKKTSQKSVNDDGLGPDVEKDVIYVTSDPAPNNGNSCMSEDDTSPGSKNKNFKLKSNKRGRTRYKEESPTDTKRPRLSPGKSPGFVEPLPPSDTRRTRTKLLPDTDTQISTKPDTKTQTVLAPDTCQHSEVPKRSSSSDLDSDLPSFVVPESVPQDFSVLDCDSNDSADGQTTVKEVKPERSHNSQRKSKGSQFKTSKGKDSKEDNKKLNIRSISTDDDGTNESTSGSPVFGQSASKVTGNKQRTRSKSMSGNKPAESPCLFDEETAGKNGLVKNEDILNVSYDGLNIKRKSSRRQSTKVKSPVVKAQAAAPEYVAKSAETFHSPKPQNRCVLKQIDNISELDESKSPSVISRRTMKAQVTDDLDETTSPSVISGKIKNFVVQEVENQDKWLSTTLNRNSSSLPNVVDKDGVDGQLDLDNGDEVESINLSKRTRSRRKKTSLFGELSPTVTGKKMVQSKITEDFFKKPKTDLTMDPDFNGGNINNSFNSSAPLTPQEKENMEMEEAIKRSLEDVGHVHILKGQGHSDSKSQVLDVGSFSQMTGPSFTSTPYVDTKKSKAKNNAKDSGELFKRPPSPTKVPKTPKRNKVRGENDSPRRSPRINKTRTSSTESSSPDSEGHQPRSRKHLDLEPNTEGQAGLGQITMVRSSDLNGSIDPNLRFSEYDGDDSHLVAKSGASSKTDVFSRTGAFNMTDSERSAQTVKSNVISRTGMFLEDSDNDPLVEGVSDEEICEDARGEDNHQEPVSLLDIEGDIESVPMEQFVSQKQRSRATRVTPTRSKVKVIHEGLEESDEDSDDLECTGTSVVFGKKASQTQKSKKKSESQNKPKGNVMDDSFDHVPKKKTGPDYKYTEVVRKRAERQKLNTFSCHECKEYYSYLKQDGFSEEEIAKRMKDTCRHKAMYRPPDTPPHYWELGFPDTQECQERGMLNTTQHKPGMRRRKGLKKLFKTEKEEQGPGTDDKN